MEWGLLGPERLESTRRTRTLGISAAVRMFNERAVPGMGGVWFGKQVFLALLGIELAEDARRRGYKVSNIETANAVEALACRLAFEGNGWESDPRLRGRRKMVGRDDLSFTKMRQRSFYVTQPMRMATGEPLIELGFVGCESQRFNAFCVNEKGREFIKNATEGFNPGNRRVSSYLSSWIEGGEISRKREALRQALSPLEPLSQGARDILREQVFSSGEGAGRRRTALNWTAKAAIGDWSAPEWNDRPAEIEDKHWRDLRAGSRFFLARDAAVAVLDTVEAYIGGLSEQCLVPNERPDPFCGKLEVLKERAKTFLDEESDSLADGVAQIFCKECVATPEVVLRSLVQRDERVLRLRDGKIVPGPVFRGVAERTEEDETEEYDSDSATADRWPEGISHRINNLFLLGQDLDGKLSKQLGGER